MSDLIERAKAALAGYREAFAESTDEPSLSLALAFRELASCYADLVLEVERLHSWDGLMSLVDEHYPEDIFLTKADDERRDPGLRIISLLRQLDRANHDRRMLRKENTALPTTDLGALATRNDELSAENADLRSRLAALGVTV